MYCSYRQLGLLELLLRTLVILILGAFLWREIDNQFPPSSALSYESKHSQSQVSLSIKEVGKNGLYSYFVIFTNRHLPVNYEHRSEDTDLRQETLFLCISGKPIRNALDSMLLVNNELWTYADQPALYRKRFQSLISQNNISTKTLLSYNP